MRHACLMAAAPVMLAALDALVSNGFSVEQLARRYGQTPERIEAVRAAVRKAKAEYAR